MRLWPIHPKCLDAKGPGRIMTLSENRLYDQIRFYEILICLLNELVVRQCWQNVLAGYS